MTVSDPAHRALDHDHGHAGEHPKEPGVEMIRSEEQLRVGTVRVPVERVRLVRRVVTETRTVEVQIRREELQIERMPISDGSAADHPAAAAGARADRELVIVLSEEVPQITMTTRPVERVRVYVEEVAGREQTVSAELRHEEIDVDRQPLAP